MNISFHKFEKALESDINQKKLELNLLCCAYEFANELNNYLDVVNFNVYDGSLKFETDDAVFYLDRVGNRFRARVSMNNRIVAETTMRISSSMSDESISYIAHDAIIELAQDAGIILK